MVKTRIVSAEELMERKDDSHFLESLQVSGTAVIRDKNGNIKGEMKITSLELVEETKNADS